MKNSTVILKGINSTLLYTYIRKRFQRQVIHSIGSKSGILLSVVYKKSDGQTIPGTLNVIPLAQVNFFRKFISLNWNSEYEFDF